VRHRETRRKEKRQR
jgi:hypothetical protein